MPLLDCLRFPGGRAESIPFQPLRGWRCLILREPVCKPNRKYRRFPFVLPGVELLRVKRHHLCSQKGAAKFRDPFENHLWPLARLGSPVFSGGKSFNKIVSPWARVTQRWMIFFNSRTLPGQLYFISFCCAFQDKRVAQWTSFFCHSPQKIINHPRYIRNPFAQGG